MGEQSVELHLDHNNTFVVSSVHQLLVALQDSLAEQQKKTFSGAVALVSGADYKV